MHHMRSLLSSTPGTLILQTEHGSMIFRSSLFINHYFELAVHPVGPVTSVYLCLSFKCPRPPARYFHLLLRLLLLHDVLVRIAV